MILCPIVDDPGVMDLAAGFVVPTRVMMALGYREWEEVEPTDFITRWCRRVGATWTEGLVTLPPGYTFEDNGRGQSCTVYVGVTPDIGDVVSLAWVTLYRVAEVWV